MQHQDVQALPNAQYILYLQIAYSSLRAGTVFFYLNPKYKHRFDQEKRTKRVVAWEYCWSKAQLRQLIRKGVNVRLAQLGVIKSRLNSWGQAMRRVSGDREGEYGRRSGEWIQGKERFLCWLVSTWVSEPWTAPRATRGLFSSDSWDHSFPSVFQIKLSGW